MWLIQKLKGKMDPPEPKSQLNDNNNNNNQQHHPDSLLHSDPSIDIDKIAQAIAKDLETLVLSCKHDQLQHTYNHSVVIHDDENQLKQQADDDLRHLAVKEEDVNEALEAESWSEIEEVERRRLEKVLEADLKEFRVLEERGTVESEIGCEKDGDLSSEIGDYENNNNNVEYEGVQHLENEIGRDGWEEGSGAVRDDGKSNSYHYPLRLDAEDCAYYIRTGMCKFGSNCKFNHPLRRRNQQPAKETKKQKEENVEKRGQTECKQPTKEMNRQKEENIEKRWQTECKYHASTAGCKYGKACKFNHGRGKTVKTPVVEYNFLGLPIRPGERECPYYMRNGSCKYGPSCRFNHPDPTAVGGDDAPTTYGNDGSLPLQPAPQSNIPNMPSWSAPITPDPPASFVSVMYPPTQNMPPPNPEWNGYQAPAPVPAHLYPSSEQGLPIPPAFFLKNPPGNTNVYTHQQQPMSVSEYPERPGQPDCSYFMKTGVCKYRASCKFHHPQSRISRTSRDQNICAYFSRHGTCKYGKACKYDHPENYHSNSNPAEGYDGSNGPRPLVHQSV